MKTGFREHLFAGILLLFIMLLFFEISAYGAVWFIIGAVLPDLDSPVSKPRRIFRWILLLVFLFLFLIFYPSILKECVELNVGWCGELPLLLILFVFLMVEVVDMVIPGHRGFLHSLPAAAFYGAGVSLVMLYFGMELVNSFWVGAWALCGYASHLLVDFVGDAIPFK